MRTGGPWPYEIIKADALGNVDGFWGGGKFYDQTVSTSIQTDFKTAAVKIAPTSCARSVTFELAIADICVHGAERYGCGCTGSLLVAYPSFTGVPGAPFGTPAGNPTNTNQSASGVPVAQLILTMTAMQMPPTHSRRRSGFTGDSESD